MTIPARISELVERFDRNLEAYKQGKYNETQVRLEFINPFFEELGWDIANKQGYAEAYKEVVHEDAIKVGGATKAPDYSFRIGGTRKFFLEAKKPSVDIKEDIHPAYQLRRYAWSAKLPLSILTDFEEFAVYDCRVKPVKTDKASHSRILYLTYTDYTKRWEEIADIFSREAILKGSFDKYVESKKTKRGTAEVDAAFLQEIERWRDLLARNIALRNPHLTHRELNFAVQRTIDRIIFLRICEDRGIEPYSRLMALQNGTRIYQRLFQLFRQADDRYNSGLFHFRPEKERSEDSLDRLTPDLNIDDRVLKDILKNLYYPDSPYEFSVLPANILGQVYEQFLGKIIRLTPAHHAIVEDKPEVRKAGGVYYTPTYIVDYIVTQTVGKLVQGKKPGPRGAVSKLKILDPACGSGSFLLGAYQFLLDWNRDEYIKDGPKKWSTGRTTRLYKTDTGEWKLTTDERKRILLNNIYGVDIDPQAVEVTKLSLLLKVLEGEDEQTISQQLVLFHQRVLPDLANNIKCGNSLIGPDFYNGQQMTFLDEEETYRINAFAWEAEFPEIMKNGGFDAVIGNPPYIQSRSGLMAERDKIYYQNRFDTVEYQINTYGLFVEQGTKLLKCNGYLGMIIPNYWLSTKSDSLLRQFLFLQNDVSEVTNVYRVFANATVDTLLLIVQRPYKSTFPKKCIVQGISRSLKMISERLKAVADSNWGYEEIYTIENGQRDVDISFSKTFQLRGERILADYLTFKFGMKPYQVGKGKPPQTPEAVKNKSFNSKTKNSNEYRPLLYAGDVRRYLLVWRGGWIKYGKHLAEPRVPELFEGPRILIRRIFSGSQLDGIYTDEPYICNTDVITLQEIDKTGNSPNIYFFLGILLSTPCALVLKSQNVNLDRATFPKINTKTLSVFPIPNIDFSNPTEKARHDHMVALVEKMLNLHKEVAEAKLPQAKTVLQRQIEATDQQIDNLVYELYGLTDKEIKIVESSLG